MDDHEESKNIQLQPLTRTAATANDHYHSVPLLLEYEKSSSSIRNDFTTIDWFFSKHKAKQQARIVRQRNAELGWVGRVKNLYLDAQGWMVLLLIGLATAVTASFIHTAAAWLSEMKLGLCHEHGFWLTRDICCLSADSFEPHSLNGKCLDWSTWGELALSVRAASAGLYSFNYFLYVLLGSGLAGLSSWLVYTFAKRAAGSGIAEIQVILGGFIMKGVLGFWTLFIKTMGLVLSVASGLNLGKEGPMVHISCCWGNVLSRVFSKYSTNEVKRREFISASAAAGVSVAFGAPLGGVLFSLESMSSYFPPKTMWRSFWCAIAAALTLQWLDPFQTGKLVQFQITYHHQWSYFELIPFAVLGALGGLCGAFFIHMSMRVSNYRKRHPWLRAHPILEVVLLCTLTSLISYPNVYLRYSTTDVLERLFGDCSDWRSGAAGGDNEILSGLCSHIPVAGASPSSVNSAAITTNAILLLVAGLAKLTLSIFTYGALVPAGIFIPALSIGACLGRVVGLAMWAWHQRVGDVFIFAVCAGKSQCVSPGIYAMIGAAATLGGVTRLTVSLAVIMFELTGGLEYIVPIMVSVVCSKLAADAFGQGGIYSLVIQMYGYPHIDARTDIDTEATASDVMVADPVALTTYGQTLQSIRTILDTHPFHGFPIINNDIERVVHGFISRADLMHCIDALRPEEVADGMLHCYFSREPPPFNSPKFVDFSQAVDLFAIRVVPTTPVDRILEMFKRLGLRYVVVCNARGRLVGLIKKKDLLLFCHRDQEAADFGPNALVASPEANGRAV